MSAISRRVAAPASDDRTGVTLTLAADYAQSRLGVYGDTVRNLLLCMGVPSPWGAPPMARLARVVIPSLPHNKFQYPE